MNEKMISKYGWMFGGVALIVCCLAFLVRSVDTALPETSMSPETSNPSLALGEGLSPNQPTGSTSTLLPKSEGGLCDHADCNCNSPNHQGPASDQRVVMPSDLIVNQIAAYPQVTLVAYQPPGQNYPSHLHGEGPRSPDLWQDYRPANQHHQTSPRQLNPRYADAMPMPYSRSGPRFPNGVRQISYQQAIEEPWGDFDLPLEDHSSFPPTMSRAEVIGAPHDYGCGCGDCAYAAGPSKTALAVDGFRVNPNREPRWRDAQLLPWESLAYGEYVGPARTPHTPEYRCRVNDQIDFVYRQTRERSSDRYRLGVGDMIAISSQPYPEEVNDTELLILQDGTVQIRGLGSVLAANKTIEKLQDDINGLYVSEEVTKENPNVLIKPIKTQTRLADLIRTVDATAGQGGLARSVLVSPDGTVQLPAIGSVPAVGLTLNELSAEANARYRMEVEGLEVTAILRERAPRFVYVLGEVATPRQVTLQGPTTVMQAIAEAGGWNRGGNLREIIVFRRDENWRLIATRLDLSGALWGNRPHPSDDLWLRDSDIVLVPKNAGQRIADFVQVYFSQGLYGVFPSQGFAVNFDGVSSLQ